jgi:hypothetical protein
MLSSPCPICDHPCSVAASSCPECGYSFESKAKQSSPNITTTEKRLLPCPDCGHNCSVAALSCPNCGRPFQQAAQSRESKGRKNNTNFPSLENATDKSTSTGAIAIVCFLVLGIGVVAFFIFWSGSNSLSPQSAAAANDALKALRKVDSATQVGVSYIQYGSLLIETQAQVNEALRILPDGELKRELRAAMEAYADVRPLWERIINGQDLIWTNYAETKIAIQKYRLNPNQSINSAMQQVWSIGRNHIDRASRLVN